MYQRRQKGETVLRIISLLQRDGAVSRTLLAEKLGLYTSTMSIRTRELLELGIIRETGPADAGSGGGGRRAVMVELEPGYGCFGGMYLRHGGVGASLFSPSLVELSRRVVPLSEGSPEDIVRACREAAGWLAGESGGAAFRGLGFAASSVVGEGAVEASSHFPWTVGELPALLSAETGVPVCTENDANLAALADLDLLEREQRSLLHLLFYEEIPTVGSGIVLDGRIYRGSTGAAGELDEGLWPLDPPLARNILRLGTLMARYLDVDALFISGEMKPAVLKELSALIESGTGGFDVRLVSDRRWVEKGAALMAMRNHIQLITGGDD